MAVLTRGTPFAFLNPLLKLKLTIAKSLPRSLTATGFQGAQGALSLGNKSKALHGALTRKQNTHYDN